MAAIMSPYAWVFMTGVSLALFGVYDVGSGLLDGSTAEASLGALSLVAGVVLTPVGLWVWNQR